MLSALGEEVSHSEVHVKGFSFRSTRFFRTVKRTQFHQRLYSNMGDSFDQGAIKAIRNVEGIRLLAFPQSANHKTV